MCIRDRGKKIYHIDHGCIPGTNFNALFDILNQAYYDQKGKDWYIDLTLVDSGDQTDLVYDFCYVHNPLTIPVKGASHPMPSRYRVSPIQKEDSVARGLNLVICDGSYYKSMIYAKINAQDGSWQVFDGVDQEYCNQVTSEHKVFERKNGVDSAADLMGAFALLEEQPEAEKEEPTYQREQDEEENWFGNDDDYDWGGDWI